jgi:hypothetical protein
LSAALLPLPNFAVNPLELLERLMSTAMGQFVQSARAGLDQDLRSYLFSTHDVAGSRPGAPFTSTPGVASVNHLLIVASTSLILGALLYSGLRTVVSAGGPTAHQLQVVLPRSLVGLVMGVFSLPAIQQLIDLNNALCQVLVGRAGVNLADLPWTSPLSGPAIISAGNNLFLLVFAAALAVAVVVLALAYVIRYTLLAVLCASAPLAAICWTLPETRGFARQWGRLLTVSLFMQVGQLLVLRVATALAFAPGRGLAGMLYAFAALYLMLRVPGALNVATHYGNSLESTGRRWSRAVRHLAAEAV